MITMKTTFIPLIAVIAMLHVAASAAAQTGSANAPTILKEFSARVQQYHDLRDKVDEGAARQTRSTDPEKIVAQKSALAARVQAARAGARQGDIFTPDVQPVFKQLLKGRSKVRTALTTRR